MFNLFSTECFSQCKCQKQQYRAVFALCTKMNFGVEKQSEPWRKQEGVTSTRRETTNSFSQRRKHPNKQQQRNETLDEKVKGQSERKQSDDRRFFFISINHMNKINGIYIYIYISKVQYGTKI